MGTISAYLRKVQTAHWVRGGRGTTASVEQRRNARPQVETLEDRCVMSAASLFYSIDGTGNNLAHPEWGSVGQDLLRMAAAQYADGISALAGASRPSARLISDVLVTDTSDGENANNRFLSDWIYVWGQFIDHDLDLTTNGTGTQFQEADIAVPTGDASFDPDGTGTQVIDFNRSEFDPATGITTPRQQLNDITAWLDGSQIYGSDAARAAALRTHVGGKLLTSAGDLLPYNTAGLPNDNQGPTPANQLFLAGDVRANENIDLTAVHTLFVREHNRLAGLIQKAHPTYNDETIYQLARSIVIAEIQSITYNEFLPALLGPGVLKPYQGYNPRVNPGIATEFSTAAFRIGHSLVGPDVEFLNPDGTTKFPEVSLANAFFNPGLVAQNGVDPILKYLTTDNAQEVDNQIVTQLQNFLFGEPGQGGFDLASLNIQRGRDHGLADYNTTRAAYGLLRVKNFAQIGSDPEVQAKLQQLYGTVDNIDLWVGGLAENHAPGSSVGPLFQRIIANQFERLRAGDRLWFENQFSGTMLAGLEHTTLAQIIARNTVNTDLQANAFFFKLQVGGTVFKDANQNGIRDRGEAGVAGRVIQLLDSSGAVVAETTTAANGTYTFDNFITDLEPGAVYKVQEVLPAGVNQTTPNPANFTFSRGETFRIDFGNTFGPLKHTVSGTTPIVETTAGVADVWTDARFIAALDRWITGRFGNPFGRR